MNEQTLLERITVDPDICHGKPCIRHLRYPVEMILELLRNGYSISHVFGSRRLSRKARDLPEL